MLHRQKCYTSFNSSYSSCPRRFGIKTNAMCSDGYCVCTGQGYDYYTCLPDTYGCKIVVNTTEALAKPQYNQQSQTTYSCTPVKSSTLFEVHVLSLYEVIYRSPVAGYTIVNIVSDGKSDRPIILVLGSYQPVNWILKLPADIIITKVILIARDSYIDQSSVGGDVNQVQAIERSPYGSYVDNAAKWPRGYGNDLVGGDTVGLLKQVYIRFGVVTSFTGTYRADEWSLMLSSARRPSTPAPVNNTRAQSSACVSAYKTGTSYQAL
ncbi:hypothetical protein OS493_014559 [Desmophyllum pertusum]|uniref:Uncharacterized protein n=1 Tax=Desmophyllum pertusum TaxID=174260 RepID=A0A9X0CMG8_9CNID|nr:hypothetical protein OS493_014559 [Desmophyllum pertusum]